jgi:predicted transposase YbfD/YdcC
MCATICGAEGWKDMQLWGETHETWLEQFLELPNGIPSRDTLRRVVCRLDPAEFQACFVEWVQGLSDATGGRIVAIDGKTCRRSMDTATEQNPVHVVSAWASEQHITLGQLAVETKSNEITAIPKLLQLIELKGALVTIDAMGCQKDIARDIVDGGGEYCLAVKGNQEHLHEDITNHFLECFENDFAEVPHDYYAEEGTAHGRSERREYYTTDVPETLRHADAWKGLCSIGVAITNRSADADGDQTQRKMMLYGMPVMFSVMMMSLPSGLTFYILVNTVLSGVQTAYLKRSEAAEAAKAS